MIIVDPAEIAEVKARRVGAGEWSREEMWDGVPYMPPMPNNEHQLLTLRLASAFAEIVGWDRGDQALPAVNVSDRADGWPQNHRGPDGVVYLAGNPAIDHGTHWQGGPDFLVEIMSPGEEPTAKFGFYAAVNTREVLIVDRYPWAVELFRLRDGALVSAGRSDLSNPAEVTSGVLPLAFRLVPGEPRPRVGVRHTGTGQTWPA
jgi:Uma2 family endonuclease